MIDKRNLDDDVGGPSILRNSAEAKVSETSDATEDLKNKTQEAIIHELQVHQIELEMQNDELKRVQLALEESRDKFQDLYDFAPVGYFTLSPKGIIKEVNLTGASLLGMPRSKLIGRGFGYFVAPESLDQWGKHILAVMGHEKKHSCVLALKCEDGSLFYVRLESIRTDAPAETQGASDGGHAIRAAVSDISQSKLLENALLLSEERFRSLTESMSNGVAIYRAKKDGEDFVFLDFNEAAEKIERISRSQVIGRSVLEVFPGVREFGLFNVLQRVWRTGKAERYPSKEYKDNRIQGWKDNYVYKLPSGEIVAVYSDETRRFIAEEASKNTEERLDLVLKGADLGFWDLDMLTGHAVINDRALDIVGYRLDEIEPTLDFWQSLLHPDDISRTLSAFEDHLAGYTDSYKADYRVKTKSGEYKLVLALGRVMERGAGGRALRVTGTFQDITDGKKAEAAFHESEERYRIVADFTYDWEYWVDGEGKFLYVSPSCERITGYSAEEFIDDPDLMNRIIHPDDLTVILDHFHNVRKVAPQAVNAMDFRIIRRDGETRWIGHICQPVYGQEGQPLGRRASNRDITTQKLAEEALERANAYHRTLIEASIDPLVTISADGRISDVNSATEKVTGYRRDELIGTNFSDYFTEPDRAMAGYQQVFQDGLVKDYELEIQHKDGHVTPVTYSASVYRDESGKVVGVFAAARDITERKRAEETVLQLVAIVESSDDAIIGKTLDGTITSWNKGAEKIYGYTEHEVVGKPVTILAPHDREDEIKGILEQVKSGKSVKRIETVRRNKIGGSFPVSLTISPIIDKEGNIVGASTITRDISDRVKLAQQREALQEQLLQAQKMEAIGTLAGGFAHDFNNKLQVIDGYVNLILFNKDLPETIKKELGVIKQTVESSAELIKGMMVFSRKTPTELQPIELNKLVAQTRSMLTRSIPKLIEIDLLLADDLWSINAAPNQIDQILMNLAVNASDAMPYGGKLTIQTRNTILDEEFCRPYPNPKPGKYVLMTVSDTGVGMSKETASRIFEPFFTTKGPDKGTGLGLAVVYGIVEQHGGMITCDSEPSVGTTFRVYFPSIEAVPQEQYSEKKEPLTGRGETILLVDDEPNFLETSSILLVDSNYEVITASNGKDALELYEKYRGKIKLVVLDLVMPKMGGEDCLRALLRTDPKVKVLMISGAQKPGIAEDLKVSGVRGLIKKPFDVTRMLEEIRKTIDEE